MDVYTFLKVRNEFINLNRSDWNLKFQMTKTIETLYDVGVFPQTKLQNKFHFGNSELITSMEFINVDLN